VLVVGEVVRSLSTLKLRKQACDFNVKGAARRMRIERRFHDDVRIHVRYGRIRLRYWRRWCCRFPLSNCVVKNVEGKTTDPGTYCWGFSREIPTAQLLVG